MGLGVEFARKQTSFNSYYTNLVSLQFEIDGELQDKRIPILTYTKTPKSSEAFTTMCVGNQKMEDGRPLSYDGTKIYYNKKEKRLIGGDILKNDGTGSVTVGGKYMDDEGL